MLKQANIFLVVNLGCEMLYVIDQRLKAQKVTAEKAIRVLTDISGILFNDKLIDELSEAQHLGSYNEIRALLESVASVSIMRLDPFSMNKLWELMTMVLKWQITLIEPQDLIVLTRRHLNGVAELLAGQEVASKVRHASDRFDKIHEVSSLENMILSRNALVFWLNDCRTKVSLLLRLGLQRNDGSFVMIKNENDPMWPYVRSIGENIYSYQDELESNQHIEQHKSSHVETSEISFLVNHMLSENEDKNKEIIKIDIFKKIGDSKDIGHETINRPCEFEAHQELTSTKNIILDDKNQFNKTSTLHEDLLLLLDEEFNNDM